MSRAALVAVLVTGAFSMTISGEAAATTHSPTPEGAITNLSNGTMESRQAGRRLIKFEGHPDPSSDDLEHGLVTFEGSTAGHPFKFVNHGAEDGLNFYPEDVIPDEDDKRIRGHDQPLKFEDQSIDRPLYYAENVGIKDDPQLAHYYPDNVGIKEDPQVAQGGHGVTFQDDNRIESQQGPDDNRIQGQGQKKKKRRRRRRKPRQQYGHPGLAYPRPIPGFPGNPGLPPGQNPYVNPGFPSGQFHRPPRRPRPSRATEALSAVTGALSSIALYDDYQCVPRLLCEAAGGGALASAGSSGLLQSIAGLQPLLTLLAAYNGASTSPLFVFGRAVFLGMTSKANPGTCRYAYPLCPTDPEQLVHYLNNHNGGFFRFFGAPQPPNPQYGLQNLEQFYNQLSLPGQPGQPGQNYGLYQPTPDQYGQPKPGYVPEQQNYGLYNNHVNQQNYGFQRPSLYNGPQQNYGSNYPYNNQNKYGFNNFKNNEIDNTRIEKRIQNIRPGAGDDDNFASSDQNPKWLFPEEVNPYNNIYNNKRGSRHLKFPEETYKTDNILKENNSNRQAKGFIFPGVQSNRQNEDVEYNSYPSLPLVYTNNDFRFEAGDDGSVDTQSGVFSNNGSVDEEGVEVIYIVRGDGDPNYPEIVKLRPGQKL